MTLRSSVRCCKCPLKHHFKTQCPIQSELRAIYHENKHEDHGCTSDDTVVIVSSCAQCALAKLHNAAFWQKIVQWKYFLLLNSDIILQVLHPAVRLGLIYYAWKNYCNKSSLFLNKKRFHWFKKLKNDFENQNFAIFLIC